MSLIKKNNRGGNRPGAGRKPGSVKVKPDDQHINFTLSFHPKLVKALTDHSVSQKMTKSAVVAEALKQYLPIPLVAQINGKDVTAAEENVMLEAEIIKRKFVAIGSIVSMVNEDGVLCIGKVLDITDADNPEETWCSCEYLEKDGGRANYFGDFLKKMQIVQF